MNAPYAAFADLLRDMLARYGRDVLRNRYFANMLRDWTRAEFADESKLFLLALKSGAADQILYTRRMSRQAAWKIAAEFSAEYCIQEDMAMETVCLLILLIRGKALSARYSNNERMYMRWRERKPAVKNARENKIIVIAGGTFKNSEGETITLPPYSIMEAPLTQLEYWSLTGDNPSYTAGGELPVDGVHWYAAVDFCNRKSVREKHAPCYAIDKTRPDPDNLAPLDLFRWKVEWLPETKGWRLPSAAEWEYAYQTNAAFTVSAGLKEWCWDFSGDLFESRFYNHTRAAFIFNERRGRPEKLNAESAEGEGCRVNVNKHRTNYGEACFSYAGNYGFRLARSGPPGAGHERV